VRHERWLKAPGDGGRNRGVVPRTIGDAEGGVISPLMRACPALRVILWMGRSCPHVPFSSGMRTMPFGHCKSAEEALATVGRDADACGRKWAESPKKDRRSSLQRM